MCVLVLCRAQRFFAPTEITYYRFLVKMTCAPGHSADLLLRYPMPYGPFNEPLDGSDCYLDEGAFFALAWIEIIMSLSLLPMFVIHLRLKKAKTRLITFAVSFCAFASIANTIVLLCAMYKPEAVRATWVLFSVSVVGYTMPVLILMIQGKVNCKFKLYPVRHALTQTKIAKYSKDFQRKLH